MEESKKVVMAVVFFFVIVAIVVALYFFVFQKKQPDIAEAIQVEEEVSPTDKQEGVDFQIPEPLPVKLEKSDVTVRSLAAELSSHSALSAWLQSKDLIRKFVVAVDNIANGQSPRSHIAFFKLEKPFDVMATGSQMHIDPESYRRFNVVADVFSSLNSDATARLFWQLKPALQEAYRDLGYPNRDFKDTLVQAILEMLEVPVIDDNIEVVKEVVSYRMIDPRLESLSPAQKHLLRMGPENIEIIQGKLKEMARGLGVSNSRLDL